MKRILLNTLAQSPENRVRRIYKTTSLVGFKIDFFSELGWNKFSDPTELLDIFSS